VAITTSRHTGNVEHAVRAAGKSQGKALVLRPACVLFYSACALRRACDKTSTNRTAKTRGRGDRSLFALPRWTWARTDKTRVCSESVLPSPSACSPAQSRPAHYLALLCILD